MQIQFHFLLKSMNKIDAATLLGLIQQALSAMTKVITIDGNL